MEIKVKYHLIYILLLLFVTIGIYSNSLQNSFVYDDDGTIVSNNFVKNWGNVPKIFTQDYFSLSDELTYRPLVTLSYFLDYSIWKLNPFGYHLTNLLFHIVNVILIYFLLLKMGSVLIFNSRFKKKGGGIRADPIFPIFTALLFATHPVQTEAVAAISFREDLMAMCFFLLSLLLYVKNSVSGSDPTKAPNLLRGLTPLLKKNSYYFASLFTFILALFSKEMAVTLPLVIILYDFCFTQSKNKTKIIYKQGGYYFGFFLVLTFYLLVRFFVFSNPSGSSDYPGGSVYLIFLTMFKVFALYIKLLFLPINLCADYIVKVSLSPFEPLVAVGMGLLIILLIISFKLYKWERSSDLESSKLVSFAILYFFITLLPVSNIIPLGRPMAERFLYMPSLGFCIVLAVILAKIPQLKIRKTGSDPTKAPILMRGLTPLKSTSILFLILILLFYSITTINRNKVWANDFVLWEETIKNSPKSSKAYYNRGVAYGKKGEYDQAIKDYSKAIEIRPDFAEAYYNRGVAYGKKGEYDWAIKDYTRVIEIKPDSAVAYYNRGCAYDFKGEYNQAIKDFNRAIELKLDYAKAYNNRGVVYGKKGEHDQAIKDFSRAIELKPDFAEAYYNREIAYEKKSEYDGIKRDF